ncbi:TNFRSF11A [Branchiostoma lanceolatum]|uniref:TNFRSF11A protein n=1 Tax=Branchiostoma lanceolatum TaxID=7740 RepID=A0A8J9ZNX5_BRALA|nr:TNFRSF11A [Branchiostoma lanceolatum]
MSSRGEVLRMGQKDSYKITTVVLLLLHVVKGEICTENQYRPFVRPWCCTSKCGPGTRVSRPCDEDDEDGTECEPCGVGLYNSGWDQDRCIPKDRCNGPNEEVKTYGTDRTDNVCQCKVGSYKDGEICRHGPVCKPGTGANRDGSCKTCPDGTFSNETSRTQPCMPWTICWKLGFVMKEAGTNISDVICISRLAPTTTKPRETATYTPAKKFTIPVAVKAGLGGVLAFAALVSIIIGGICTWRRKYDRAGTGAEGEMEAFPVVYTRALPDQVYLQNELQNTGETLPLRPHGGNEMDMPSSELRSRPTIPDEGFSTGDDSCSDTLSELSAITAANSETAINASPEHEFDNPADMPVEEDMIAYLEQHVGKRYLSLARKLPFKDETTRLQRTDIDSLKNCQLMDGMHEAIRRTVETWKTRNGDQANLKGLLIGLHNAGMGTIVNHFCEKYNGKDVCICS